MSGQEGEGAAVAGAATNKAPAGNVAPAAVNPGHPDRGHLLSLVGIGLGFLLLAVGLVVGLFWPQESANLGNFPIFIACVGLAAILAGLGSQATYISGPISLGGGAAIAGAFFLLFTSVARDKPANSFEGQLSIYTPAVESVSASLWVANEKPLAGQLKSRQTDHVTFFFPLDSTLVDKLFKTGCSRFEINTGNGNESILFSPKRIGIFDYFTVLNVWYRVSGKTLFFHPNGIPQNIEQKCDGAVILAETKAASEETIPQRGPTAPVATPPTPAPKPVVVTPAAVSESILGWSFFGIQREGETGFVEKNFGIVARGRNAPPISPAGNKPLKGDTLVALTDIKVREGPRRRVDGVADQWENPKAIGVIKAGEKVLVVDTPQIVNAVSHWVPISAKLD